MRGEFRRNSNDNTLFTTARCNNRCIMCCQPPSDTDDTEWLFERNISIINRAPKDIPVVGISGGEPTLLGDRLIDLIRHIRQTLPESDLHILTNGRNFKDADYVRRVADAADGRLITGIPLHSDYCGDHDIIAGAKEAFNETMAGLFNLASFGVAIELRIVIHRLNFMRLLQMAEFILKNLPFVSWTAFMAMEHIGHAVSNERKIWIEPTDYASQLEEAVLTLAQWRREVTIYNVPHCLIPESIHPYAQKSISDWKNLYLPECGKCSLRSRCCGLFATSKRSFKQIKPVYETVASDKKSY